MNQAQLGGYGVNASQLPQMNNLVQQNQYINATSQAAVNSVTEQQLYNAQLQVILEEVLS